MSDKKAKRAPYISLVIPMFNEESAVEPLVDRLIPVLRELGLKRGVQLIVVDDGSTDRTHEVLMSQLARIRSRVRSVETLALRHQYNCGIGAAMATGFKAATGEIVCTMDSDCTYSPEDLLDLIECLQSSDAGIATGSPYHPKGRVENAHPARLFISKAASRMYSCVAPVKLHCYTSMFRAHRRQWARPELIQSNGFLGVTEALVSAAFQGAKIVEFPVTLGLRRHGQSKMRVCKTTFQHLGLMVRILLRRIGLGIKTAQFEIEAVPLAESESGPTSPTPPPPSPHT